MISNSKFPAGSVVEKSMGVRIVGRVLDRFPARSEYSDGSYREPTDRERASAVPVQWCDGSIGWIADCYLRRIDRDD